MPETKAATPGIAEVPDAAAVGTRAQRPRNYPTASHHATPSGDRLIAEIAKTNSITIRVGVHTFKGRTAIDVREFVAYRGTGELGPTRARLRLPVELIAPLITALEAARAALAGEGGANA